MRLFSGHLEERWRKRVEQCTCKPDHLAPKNQINETCQNLGYRKSFRVVSYPLSPSITDLQIFDSKRAKTLFAQWTTFFILVASNLHSAEGLTRLRDVRLFNEMTQERDLNATTSHSAATCFFMVLRLWVVSCETRQKKLFKLAIAFTINFTRRSPTKTTPSPGAYQVSSKPHSIFEVCLYVHFFPLQFVPSSSAAFAKELSWDILEHAPLARNAWQWGTRDLTCAFRRSAANSRDVRALLDHLIHLITWCPLQSEDANHYQDYDTSRIGDPKFNLRLPLFLSGGASQPMSCCVSSNKMLGRMIYVKHCLFCIPEGVIMTAPFCLHGSEFYPKKNMEGEGAKWKPFMLPNKNRTFSSIFYPVDLLCVCASLQKLRKAPASNNAAKRTSPDSDHKRWFWTRTKNDIRRNSIHSIHSVFHSQNLDPAWCAGLTNVCRTLVVRQLLGIGSTRAWSTPRN